MSFITLSGKKGTYYFNPDEDWIKDGGMGRVFKGFGTIVQEGETIEIKVAIKVLYSELSFQESNLERFRKESAVNVRHKNLVEILDFVEDEGYYIISEYLEGVDLSDKLVQLNQSGNTFTLEEAKSIILVVAEGLEALHKHGILHRDLKPSNIMLLEDGNIKLFDYGVVKLNKEQSNKLTREGSFVGSYQYASPEQIRNVDESAINESSDVYSLGITFYELITGQVPFDGSSDWEIMDKQTREIIPRHSKIPQAYYHLIAKATAKDQQNRYKTVSEFRNDLLKLPQGPVTLLKKPWTKSGRFNLIAGAAACILVLFFVWRQYLQKNYAKHVHLAETYYEKARYDSAQVHYEKALSFKSTDSIRNQSAIMQVMAGAMKDFYDANFKSACEKLKVAADLGSGDAYYYLAKLTYNGIGMVKDYKLALAYSHKAVKYGFAMGYFRLAMAYEQGKGVEAKDKIKANTYYVEALLAAKTKAEIKDPEALQLLGWMYTEGSGVSENKTLGSHYNLRAAQLGHLWAQTNLASMYRNGNGVDQNMDSAISWYTRAADKGFPVAQYELGIWYLYGDDALPKNESKGLEYIQQAAEQNYSPALNFIGASCHNGDRKEIPLDYKKAASYYRRSIEYDHDNGLPMENMAKLYRAGLGVDTNYAIARDYFISALKTDSSRTTNYLQIAQLYLSGGYGLVQNELEFIRFCELAEYSVYPDSKEEARGMLARFYGSKAYEAIKNYDYAEARRYLHLAAGKGNERAPYVLEIMNKNNMY